jgi:nitrogen-specific signal transduction histidine kinase
MKNYYILLGFYHLLVCVLFHYLKKTISVNSKALNYWIAGFFIFGVGILGYTFYDNHTDPFSLFLFSLAFNFFALVGVFFIFHGYNVYEQRKSNLKFLITLPILSFLCSFVFTFVYPSDQLRMATNGILLTVGYVYIAHNIRNKKISKFSNNKYSYYIVALIHVSRIYHAIYINKNNFMPETLIAKTLIVIGCLLAMVIVFNIIIVLMTDINQALNEQLQTKDKLYRVISHDVKGQLNNLVNYHYVLKKSFKDWSEEKINKWVLEIENIAISSYTLLENMLLWSSNNKEKLKLSIEKHNLIELVNNAILFYSAQLNFKNQEISLNDTPEIIIECDKNMVDSILRNLIENAIKHTITKEKIEIFVTHIGDSIQFSIVNKFNQNHKELSQKLDAIIQNTIHNPTGYGLLISNDFITRHQGKLNYNILNENYLEINFTLPIQLKSNEE